ncbi:MAG: DEAD/DEAH box helicase family protein [Bdellovibrionota bacterium]
MNSSFFSHKKAVFARICSQQRLKLRSRARWFTHLLLSLLFSLTLNIDALSNSRSSHLCGTVAGRVLGSFEEYLNATEVLSDFNQELTDLQQAHLREVIAPMLGSKLLIKHTDGRPRACAVGSSCVLFGKRLPEENDLAIEWSETSTTPEITDTPSTTTLHLPARMSVDELRAHGEAFIQNWTMGHALHPFITIKSEKDLLGPTDKFKLRKVQAAAIAVGNKAFDEGKNSFLYVAPTGTGKTEVLTSNLSREMEKTQNDSKFHIMVAHQNELVSQFKDDIKKAHKGGLKVLEEFDIQTLIDPNFYAETSPKKAKLVAITIQALVKALEKATPEEISMLRSRLGVLVFDEAHHLGAKTWLQTVKTLLHENPNAKLLGATATPLHQDARIQALFNDLFNGQSFWAYLDSEAQKEGIARDTTDVIEQLDIAIGTGNLAPLKHFYSVDPNSFTHDNTSVFARKDPNNDKSDFEIKHTLLGTVVKRFSPLIDRHRSGFVAANNIVEAGRLQEAFSKAMPHKKFEVFHGDLTAKERKRIRDRIEQGEDLFLITVNLLDEGVDFPNMSLYIDLNHSLGVRQLLQRWGRVARVALGKKGIEIATLTDWRDANHIRDKISLLEKFAVKPNTENPHGAFRGKYTSTQERKNNLANSNSEPALEGLTPIDDHTKREQLLVLLQDARNIFEKENKASPLERVIKRVAEGKGIPSQKEDPSAYQWAYHLPNDPNEWPTMPEEVKQALIQWKANRRTNTKTGKNEKGPLERITSSVKDKKGIPSQEEDSGAYRWAYNLPDDPKKWPTMPEEVKQALIQWKANIRPRTKYEKGPLERVTDSVKAEKGIPSKTVDSGAYNWAYHLPNDPNEWPTMPEEVKQALIEFKANIKRRTPKE